MIPTFTVLIGSAGRPTLFDSLNSIHRQNRVVGDQVIVSFDAYEWGPRPDLQAMVQDYGDGFLATAYDSGEHWLGVRQINHAMRTVNMTGSHIFTIGDDDVFVDGAYDVIRGYCEVFPDRPILYRFVAPNGWVLWDVPRFAPCLISGCCIAAPKQFVGYHPTERETTHDYRWMEAILLKARAYGKEPIWLDYVGVVARPTLGHKHQVTPPRVVEPVAQDTPNAYEPATPVGGWQ